jgi:hypothetical protein
VAARPGRHAVTLPLVRARRRRVRIVAPVPLMVAVASLGCELACVVVALGAGPGSPRWLPGVAFAGTVGFAGLAIGTLRRAVSGRPRTARHHGTVTSSGTHRVAPPNRSTLGSQGQTRRRTT